MIDHIPFGLHDSHTSADLEVVSGQPVDLQVPSSAPGFHTQKTKHMQRERLDQNTFQLFIRNLKVNDNIHLFKNKPSVLRSYQIHQSLI